MTDLEPPNVKKICVLQFSSESNDADFFKAHEWFAHLLRRDLMCIRSFCVDDYLDSPLEWDLEWNKVKEHLFSKRKIDIIIKGIIEYDEKEALIAVQIVFENETKEIEKNCSTIDILKVEKEILKEICKITEIEMNDEEELKTSKIPQIKSLCSFSEILEANLRRGMKYADAISSALINSKNQQFLATSVSAILLDEFLSSKEDENDLVSICEKSLELDPDDPQVYWRIGKTLLLQNKPEKAVEYANKGIETAPSYARNYITAAMGYEELGDDKKSSELSEIGLHLITTDAEV